MKIVKDTIKISELVEMMKNFNGVFVKAVADIEKGIMAVDAELHMDLMTLLIEKESSEPKNIWGFNIYPEALGNEFIEFDSMVNIKPGLGNRTRGIDNVEVQHAIRNMVKKLVS